MIDHCRLSMACMDVNVDEDLNVDVDVDVDVGVKSCLAVPRVLCSVVLSVPSDYVLKRSMNWISCDACEFHALCYAHHTSCSV